MALSRRLHEDQEGSAAVEFVVLLPVYLMLLFGLFSLSFMLLARQALPIVARFDTWAGPLDPQLRKGVLGRFSEAPAAGAQRTSVLIKAQDLSAGQGQPGQQKMAATALNNSYAKGASGEPFQLQSTTTTLKYTGLVLGTRDISISVQEAVYVWLPHTRPTHQDGSQEHFAADKNFVSPSNGFDPAQDANRYQPARVGFLSQEGGPGVDPGVWNKDARLNGGPHGAAAEYGVYSANKSRMLR